MRLAGRPTPRYAAFALALAVVVALGIAAQPAGGAGDRPGLRGRPGAAGFLHGPGHLDPAGALGGDAHRQRLRRRARPNPHRRDPVQETDTIGLKVPVVMEVSPYYGNVNIVRLGRRPRARPAAGAPGR